MEMFKDLKVQGSSPRAWIVFSSKFESESGQMRVINRELSCFFLVDQGQEHAGLLEEI